MPLRESLDAALAPDEPSLRFVDEPGPIACTQIGCENSATTWLFIRGDDGEIDPAGRCNEHADTRFTVDTDAKANWAFHRLRAAERERDDIIALYDAEIERLNAWKATMLARPSHSIAYFNHQLARYGMTVRAKDPEGRERTKHALPAGTIRFTRSQSVEVEDEEALVAWAESSHPDLVKRTPKIGELRGVLAKDAQKQLQAVTVDGEVVPGIRIDRRVNTAVITAQPAIDHDDTE